MDEASFPAEAPDYDSQWKELDKRSRVVWGMFAAYAPAVSGFAFLAAMLMQAASGPLDLLVAVTYIVVSLMFSAHLSNFPCPRCGQPFFRTKSWGNPFSRRCMHCGLQRNAGRSR